ncbi:MAG: sulfatase-like hydrolase/transferase, partial [Candidatus Solibacter sp.]|nr:sulfatase-like hydrolase/transferase [Candidatus Solibacter sp.]
PLQATQKYLDRFANIANKRHRMLAAMTSAMDDAIGAIVSKVRESGLEKDTVICFLSDNGCPIYTRAGSNGPLNGCKCTYYEGGIRVPFAMQWPGHIPAGQTYRHPVVSRDIFPTFLNLAGARLPQDREYDGVDLMPYLTSKKEGAPHDILFWRAGSNSAARRGNWKLIAVGEDK